jgi:hypothetical protein
VGLAASREAQKGTAPKRERRRVAGKLKCGAVRTTAESREKGLLIDLTLNNAMTSTKKKGEF